MITVQTMSNQDTPDSYRAYLEAETGLKTRLIHVRLTCWRFEFGTRLIEVSRHKLHGCLTSVLRGTPMSLPYCEVPDAPAPEGRLLALRDIEYLLRLKSTGAFQTPQGTWDHDTTNAARFLARDVAARKDWPDVPVEWVTLEDFNFPGVPLVTPIPEMPAYTHEIELRKRIEPLYQDLIGAAPRWYKEALMVVCREIREPWANDLLSRAMVPFWPLSPMDWDKRPDEHEALVKIGRDYATRGQKPLDLNPDQH